MGTVVFILGRSGTGKSYSMRNFDPSELAIINVQGKVLPFKGGAKFTTKNTDNADEIISAMKVISNKVRVIVIDDFQYLMANEFMRRSNERGFDKFTDIAKNAWSVIDSIRLLPDNVIVYVMCHIDTGDDGVEKLKTIGKLLDEKIVLEGMSTIVLKTCVADGNYTFVTQNNGKDTVKSPFGMFPSRNIQNDLKYVDEKIRNYYGFDGAVSDADIDAMDSEAVVETPEPRKRVRRSEQVSEEPVTPAPAPVSEPVAEPVPAPEAPVTEEAPVRRRRRKPVTEQAETPEDFSDLPFAIPETPEGVTETIVPRRRRRTVEQSDNGGN
jgi:hypothetical protein